MMGHAKSLTTGGDCSRKALAQGKKIVDDDQVCGRKIIVYPSTFPNC
jgi:hypothetical protein